MKNNLYDSFELLYVYLENIRCFKSNDASFSTQYTITYDNNKRKLSILQKKENESFDSFFGNNISSINTIVGINGSGKTTLLQLIGSDLSTREKLLYDYYNNDTKEKHYFLIFKTNYNHIYIEGFNICFEKIEINDYCIHTPVNKKDKYFSFIINTDSQILMFNDRTHVKTNFSSLKNDENISSVLINDKKTSLFYLHNNFRKNESPLLMTKYNPLLNRECMNVENKHINYHMLYRVINSNFEFINLFTSDITFSLKIYLSCHEELVIASKLLNSLDKDFKMRKNVEKTGLIINMISAFIINEIDFNDVVEINIKNKIFSKKIEQVKEIFFKLIETEKNISKIKIFIKNKHLFEDILSLISEQIDKILSICQDNIIEYNLTNEINDLINSFKEYKNYSKDGIHDGDLYFLYKILEDLKNIAKKMEIFFKVLQKINTFKNDNIITDYNTFKMRIDEILQYTISIKTNNNSLSQFDLPIRLEVFKELLEKTLKLPNKIIDLYQGATIFFEIEINKTKSFKKKIYNFLKSYCMFVKHFNKEIFVFSYGQSYSKGEFELLDKIVTIYEVLCKVNSEMSIILLDEPDESLHPEWSRRYIYCLTNMINEFLRVKDYKVQIILTTHSPYILSDMPKEFVTTIEISKNHKRRFDKANKSFASNYYDIIKDSFFLDNTIGYFALDKIKKIHKTLSEALIMSNTSKTEIIKRLERDTYIKNENQLKHFISIIDEPIIRFQLQYLFKELKQSWDYVYLSNSSQYNIDELTLQEKKQIYEKLKTELENSNE